MAASGSSARVSVLRSALLFTPFLAIALAVMVYLLLETADEGVSAGSVIGLVFVGFVALLIGYQFIQSVRDLFAKPIETVGIVERRWSRSDFFLFQNTYIFLGRDVYRLAPEQALDIGLGDTVRVRHFPHTSTVEDIELVERAEQAEEGGHERAKGRRIPSQDP